MAAGEKATVLEVGKKKWRLLVILVGLYGVLFYDVWRDWGVDCWNLDDFSHCLLIPIISAYIIYSRKQEVLALRHEGGKIGMIILLGSIPVYFYGLGYSWNVFQRVGALGVFLGLVGYILGSSFLYSQRFSLGYLVLAIPIPFVLYNKISILLRGSVTILSASILQTFHLPAYNEGNILIIGDHLLGVVDACSGIRSIMAIFSVAILFSYMFKSGLWGGIFLSLMTLPIAVAMNIARILTMAVFIFNYNIDLTSGVLHDLLGFFIFALILLSMYATWAFIKWVFFLEKNQNTELSPA